MFAPRWMNKLASDNSTKLGVAVLQDLDVFQDSYWYWIAAAALVGYIIVLNVAFTVAVTYLNPLGKPQAVIPKEEASIMKSNHEDTQREPGPKAMGLVSSQSPTDGSNIRKLSNHVAFSKYQLSFCVQNFCCQFCFDSGVGLGLLAQLGFLALISFEIFVAIFVRNFCCQFCFDFAVVFV